MKVLTICISCFRDFTLLHRIDDYPVACYAVGPAFWEIICQLCITEELRW
jgi:hypothetical protein